jgi:predicted nucleotidyltransferase
MPESISSIVDPFLTEADRVLGGGYTALLFGSAARGEHIPGRSDVNLMLIVPSASPATLRSLHGAFEAWRRKMPVLPLLITREEWLRSADAFPIEIADMRMAYKVLRGPDLLAGMNPERAELRSAVEKELRGKLLRLRQRYVAGGRDDELANSAAESIATMLLLFRCLLVLSAQAAPPGGQETIRATAALVKFDPEPVIRIFQRRADRRAALGVADFEGYLDAVERTARYVDQLQPGDQQ